MPLQNGPERKYHLIVVRRLATGDVFDFINNSHRTDPKENGTAAQQHTYILTHSHSLLYI
jgi:hypothetical protein